jgi:dTDP-4-amino-4,6-dideoxygalactose transaminase
MGEWGKTLAKRIIRLSKSCLGNKEKKAVLDVLDKEYLGMGEEVKKFETALSSFFNRSAICVVNGTCALQLALQSIGIKTGDEVLVPSLTYLASYQAISALGAIPVSCDINPENLIINVQDAEKRITKRTRCIMPVFYSGGVGDLEEIYNLALNYNLRVVEDAAHAFGTRYNDKLIGSFVDISCFSFDGIKNITSGEGGCIVTDDDKVISLIQDLRLLGVKNDTENRFRNERTWTFDVYDQGWRYHMSNIMAAIGLEQLKKFDKFALKRRNFSNMYDKILNDKVNIKIIDRDYSSIVPHIYPIRINKTVNRDNIRKTLISKGIQTGVHYFPNHLLTKYRSKNFTSLPITEEIFPELITLPLHPDLNENDIVFVCNELLNAINQEI